MTILKNVIAHSTVFLFFRQDVCEGAWFPGMKIKYPLIAYSKMENGSYVTWSDTPNVGFADTLVVSTINL